MVEPAEDPEGVASNHIVCAPCAWFAANGGDVGRRGRLNANTNTDEH